MFPFSVDVVPKNFEIHPVIKLIKYFKINKIIMPQPSLNINSIISIFFYIKYYFEIKYFIKKSNNLFELFFMKMLFLQIDTIFGDDQ
jgi:hypothetical protein